MYIEIKLLLEASRKGDIDAKEKLLLKVNPLIIASIRRYYNRIELYDDLIQEGYEVVLLAIDNYDSSRGIKFLGYVKSLLKYKYLEKHREKRHLSLNEPLEDGEFIDLLIGDEVDPGESIIGKEETQSLIDSLYYLTKRQRQVLVEYYINQISIKEIGTKLGISYRTVVNTKTRALNKLKKAMVK